MLELSEAGRITAAIAVFSAVTVMSGGYFLTRVAASDVAATPFQRSFFRAGHGHAGVLIILGLLSILLTEATSFTGFWQWTARTGVLVGAILMPAGFFFSAMGTDRQRPSGLIALVYLGAAAAAAGLITLGIGLIRG